jgi:hypothetical protein
MLIFPFSELEALATYYLFHRLVASGQSHQTVAGMPLFAAQPGKVLIVSVSERSQRSSRLFNSGTGLVNPSGGFPHFEELQ